MTKLKGHVLPQNKRQSNFELLRILSMFLIVMHHIAVHGEYGEVTSVNYAVLRFFEIGGKIGVNLFVLISGYFMVNSEFKFKKLVYLAAEIIFYSLLYFIILLSCGKVTYSVDFLQATLFPLLSNSYWFASAYIITYCLSPYLNSVIKNTTKKQLIYLIVFLLILQCYVPFTFGPNFFSNVGWFLTLYLIAAYLKVYPVKITDSNKILLPSAILTYLAIALLNIFTDEDFWLINHAVCTLCSVAAFCSFKNFNIGQNKVINAVAKTTFGVYLIHDNIWIRHILWVELLKCPTHAQNNLFIIFAVVAVLLVFALCMLIDIIRELIFTLLSNLAAKAARKLQVKTI